MSPKQKAFIDYYLANGNNGTQAAISAGYSEKSARSRATKLLQNEEIGQLLKQKQKATSDDLQVTANDLYKKYEKAYLMAMKNEKPGDMVKAVKAQADILGLNAVEKNPTSGHVIITNILLPPKN